jgi:hypothetical protein
LIARSNKISPCKTAGVFLKIFNDKIYSMKRGILFFFIVVALFILLIVLFPKKKKGVEEFEFLPETEEEFEATLFFLNSEGKFVRVERKLKQAEFLEERIKECILALKDSPEGLTSPIPQELDVRDVILSSGIAFINLSEEILKFPFGTRSEIEMVYAIVNSLSATFPEVKGVKFLVGSSEVETIGGHISTKDVVYPDYEVFEK